MPRFLKDGKFMNKLNQGATVGNSSLKVEVMNNDEHGLADDKTSATSPPSPMVSEHDGVSSPLNRNDPLNTSRDSSQNQASRPASLPRDLARVRYSLRTSIGDGTVAQPGGSASMMERRELRPNNVHINVSHWSDFGGRNYMEDR